MIKSPEMQLPISLQTSMDALTNITLYFSQSFWCLSENCLISQRKSAMLCMLVDNSETLGIPFISLGTLIDNITNVNLYHNC